MSSGILTDLHTAYYHSVMYSVYRHLDGNGRLLYVGCTCNMLRRHLAHKQVSGWFSSVVEVQVVARLHIKKRALDRGRQEIIKGQPVHNINKHKIPFKYDPVKYYKYLEKFSKRADAILALRRAGWTLERIAKRYDLTRQRVHQIVNSRA